ncbi:FG-GAP repeat-containing protein [Myxococcus stipitatus DSM 14675]|uniref:FG-GAP repeat-containing protein n=1 Tax=Myxococcus stipitatus (strain DSM 14675 / JCM 12634 / Mx s8) TaxID=1278073 RepID=L7U4M9_MYXSD|nr:lysyl oxidase family protein [Myxococcus stipitatus]AGC41444.1 FG-GAP repeat-containing protein [Myxococcus stipitatus DSM 14675]
MRSWWRWLAVVGAVFGGSGCEDNEPSERLLSETPLWRVTAAPNNSGECFGGSLALADFNGDGRKDLVVGTELCQEPWFASKFPGRVSIFPGQESFFSTQHVSALMTWRSTSPLASGVNLGVSAGDVNGDGFADLLVHSRFGVNVFLGQADLETMLREPAFRVAGGNQLSASSFLDLNGDGLGDFIVNHLGQEEFYLATPGAPSGLFTRALVREGFHFSLPMGDLNGDGAEDVLLSMGPGQPRGYFLGCKPGSAFSCNGPISSEPWHTESEEVVSRLIPDMNGDGYPEAFLGGQGGVSELRLSEPDGRLASSAVWSMLGDPVYPLFGDVFRMVGDLDGDGHRQDFVVGSIGRLYVFSPQGDVSEALQSVWAWPRADTLPNGYDAYRRYVVEAPGDLDGDGLEDLIVASRTYGEDMSQSRGDVSVYGGGKRPARPVDPPRLLAFEACGLGRGAETGKPDLTVDKDALQRSVHVTWRTFAAEGCEVKEQCVNAPGRRKLLRFSTVIQNLGNRSAILPSIAENPDLYVYDECHRHDHLINFAAYELRDTSGQSVLTGRKQGFRLLDLFSYCADAAPQGVYGSMGISPGWADIYTVDTPCQWVDITDLPDGTYDFQVSVDTRDIVDEGTVHPNTVSFPVRLEGNAVTVLP